MSYNFTVPSRADIARPEELVNIRIRHIGIALDGASITLDVLRTNRVTFSNRQFVYSIVGEEFTAMIAAVSQGYTVYDAVKAAAYDFLMSKHKREMSFVVEPPLFGDGTQEATPAWAII